MVGEQGGEERCRPLLDTEVLAVSLPVFEGPLDLLLHLVREHRLDIFDIPIAFITSKYLEMIERMRELNLDVAGEFLVMAATLAHIKSRMLLPRPEADDEHEEDLEGDPRADLVRRLLEYQKYREAAGSLGSQDILDRDVFVRRGRPEAPAEEGEIGVRQVSVFRLIEALDDVLARSKADVAHEIVREKISLSERLTQMLTVLAGRERMSFAELFDEQREREGKDEPGLQRQARGVRGGAGGIGGAEGSEAPRAPDGPPDLIVMTFLALLEMSRLGLARITQEDIDGEIIVAATERTKEAGLAEVRDDFR